MTATGGYLRNILINTARCVLFSAQSFGDAAVRVSARVECEKMRGVSISLIESQTRVGRQKGASRKESRGSNEAVYIYILLFGFGARFFPGELRI